MPEQVNTASDRLKGAQKAEKVQEILPCRNNRAVKLSGSKSNRNRAQIEIRSGSTFKAHLPLRSSKNICDIAVVSGKTGGFTSHDFLMNALACFGRTYQNWYRVAAKGQLGPNPEPS